MIEVLLVLFGVGLGWWLRSVRQRQLNRRAARRRWVMEQPWRQ